MANSKNSSFKYHAFISYRHADNKTQGRKWATWLHQAIETYEVPNDLVGQKNSRGDTIPPRIYPVFRDEQELPAHADLGTSIVSALEQTNLLIVLCSPRAVASTYVADEIDYFKKLGNSGHIIAAMIDGEPNTSWDEGKQKLGFTKADECFPVPLQYEYNQDGNATDKHAEPIAADFRINNNGKPEQGFTSPAAYREHLKNTTQLDKKSIAAKVNAYQQQLHLMLLKIIAGILGVPLGELTQRDKEYQLEQERLKAKKLRRWLAAVAILAILAVGAGVFAYFQKEEAIFQQQLAIKEKNGAQVLQSEFLTQMSKNQSEKGEYDTALLLSLNAIPGLYGGDRPLLKGIELSFHEPLEKINRLMNINAKHPLSRQSVKFDQTGRYVATVDNRTLTIWSLDDGKPVTKITSESRILNFDFSYDSRFIFTSAEAVDVWSVLTGEQVQQFDYPDRQLGRVAFHPVKNLLAITSVMPEETTPKWLQTSASKSKAESAVTSYIDIFDAESAEITTSLSIKNVIPIKPIFSPDGTKILSVAVNHGTYLWSLETGKLIQHKFVNDFSDINTKRNRGTLKAGFSPNGAMIFSEIDKSKVAIWSAETGEILQIIKISEKSSKLLSAQFSQDNKKLLTLSDYSNQVLEWSVATGEILHRYQLNESHLSYASYSPGSDLVLASSFNDKKSIVWSADSQALIKVIDHSLEAINLIDMFSAIIEGNFFTVFGEKIVSWSLTSQAEISLFLNKESYFIKNIHYSFDNKFVVVSQRDGKHFIWDIKKNNVLHELDFGKNTLQSYIFPQQNKLLITREVNNKFESEALVYDLQTGEKLDEFIFEGKLYRDIKFSPDGDSIIYVVKKPQEQQPLKNEVLQHRNLLTGVTKSIARNNLIPSYEFNRAGKRVLLVSTFNYFSSDVKKQNFPSEVILFDLISSKREATHPDLVNPKIAIFSPFDDKILVQHDTKKLSLFSADFVENLSTLFYSDGHWIRDFIFHPDGNGAIFIDGNSVAVWKFKDEQPSIFKRHSLDNVFLVDVSISSDHQYLLTTSSTVNSERNTSVLWDVNTMAKIETFSQVTKDLPSKFSNDSKSIVTTEYLSPDARFPTAKVTPIFQKMLKKTDKKMVSIKDYEEQAINSLPINRSCLTPAERRAFFLPALSAQQWQDRGCAHFTSK